MLAMLSLLTAHAGDASAAYAEQQLVRHIFDSRAMATQYTASVAGDSVVYTPELVQVGSYSWIVEQGDERLTGWTFAERVGDEDTLLDLRGKKARNHRRTLIALGLGAPMMVAGFAMLRVDTSDPSAFTTSYLLRGGGGVGLGLGLMGYYKGRSLGQSVDDVYTAEEVDAAIRRYNEALAIQLRLDPDSAAASHPDVLLHRSE